MTNDHVNISLELLLKHSGSNLYFGVKCSRRNVYLLPRSLALRHQSLARHSRFALAFSVRQTNHPRGKLVLLYFLC